jgi:hypothetical protein
LKVEGNYIATYSNNTTIKFVTSIQLSVSNGSTGYTVPSGHFAIIGGAETAWGGGGYSVSVVVGGVSILSNITARYNGGDMHLGEGSSISLSASSKFDTAKAFGAVFKNTP